MSLIYLELARLANEDRDRAYAPDAAARRRAAQLRSAAACCRVLATRIRGMLGAARGRRTVRAAACC